MKPYIVLYKKLPADLHHVWNNIFPSYELKGSTEENRTKVFNALRQAEGLIGSGGTVDKGLLDAHAKPARVSTVSVGYDNFDVGGLTRRGIPLMHTPTVLTETVADTVMALVLSTARRVVECRRTRESRRMEQQYRCGLVWYRRAS